MYERTSSNSHSDSTNRKPRPENRMAIPETGGTSTAAFIKSFVRKNLLASPMFPRLYADVVISSAPNSLEAKILARNYKKIIAYTERTKQPMSNIKSCTHIKVTGVRCGSPALRGEQFCYFHQRMLRTVKFPASRVHHTALLEDEESIQVSLMEVVNALLRGTIELKRAELILRALNTAVRNIRRVKFSIHSDEMVREIPNYPDPPSEPADQPAAAPRRPPSDEEVARQRAASLAEYFGGPEKIPANLKPTVPAAAAPPASLPAPGLECNPIERKDNERGDSRPRLSRRPRSTGPQRRATEASPKQNNRGSNAQASSKRESRSSEGAQECSPRRPWVRSTHKKEQAPQGTKETEENALNPVSAG